MVQPKQILFIHPNVEDLYWFLITRRKHFERFQIRPMRDQKM